MRPLILSFFIFSLGIDLGHAQVETVTFKNEREGKSYYSNYFQKRSTNRVRQNLESGEIIGLYNEALAKQKSTNLCAYNLNAELSASLESKNLKADLKSLVYILREENEIDDVTAKVLLTAHEVSTTPTSIEDAGFHDNSEKTKSIIRVITAFEKRILKNKCFDDAYRAYYSELKELSKNLKPAQLKTFHVSALEQKLISEKIFVALEQGRLNDLHETTLSLSSYQQKLTYLRKHYPLRDPSERSDFVTLKMKKMNSSRRQKLYENYSPEQIVKMGNIIKAVRERLEIDKVDIVSSKDGKAIDSLTVVLDPMERVKFAVRVLRKEMSTLPLNYYFKSRAPDFIDLMSASYEIGIIPQTELEAVASMEEMWNPKKSLWEKSSMWVRTFSSVATIAIPPPYGFIPALVLVVIEATVPKAKDPNKIDPTVLF